MRKIVLLVLVSVLLLSTVPGCTDANPYRGVEDDLGEIAGFSQGLWHGATFFPQVPASLFMDVSFYDSNNTGVGYYFGFLLGAVMFLCGLMVTSIVLTITIRVVIGF